MGSELFAYFTADQDKATVEEAAAKSGLAELSGGDTSQMVARLDAESEIKRGDEAELWLDAEKLVLFEPESGERIHA